MLLIIIKILDSKVELLFAVKYFAMCCSVDVVHQSNYSLLPVKNFSYYNKLLRTVFNDFRSNAKS